MKIILLILFFIYANNCLATGSPMILKGGYQTELEGIVKQISTPSTPSSGYVKLYAKSDKKLYIKDSTGSESAVGSGGGGGGALQWIEAASSPLADIENNVRVYLYQNALTQNLYTIVKVPNTYVAGSQITMRIHEYSPDSSGNILLRSQSTLIRGATDAMSSTTNQRTSTNSAVTVSAGTVNEPQTVSLDLTDSSGQINSVAVAADDTIIVRLYRDTDTATSDLRVAVYSAEVKFQ